MRNAHDQWGSPISVPAQVAAIAQRQGGAISTAQLTGLGLHGDQLARMVAAGWLSREHRSAYLVTGHTRTARGRLHVALFAYGDASALTGRAAAVARGLIQDLGSTVHVVLPSSRRPRAGVTPHRAVFVAEQVGRLRCVPVKRMLLDLAVQESASLVQLVVRKAGEAGLLEGVTVDRGCRHPGARRLRGALAHRDPNRGETRSSLERRMSEFLVEYGFPPADRNVKLHVDGGEVLTLADFVWGWACCCLEADHRSTHSGGERFDEDRQISRKLQAAGWSTPRATGADLDSRARRDALADEMWAIFELAIERWWLPGMATRQRES